MSDSHSKVESTRPPHLKGILWRFKREAPCVFKFGVPVYFNPNKPDLIRIDNDDHGYGEGIFVKCEEIEWIEPL